MLQYLDAIGATLQGAANALVWLTNPSFFKSFKDAVLKRMDYFGCLKKGDQTRIPLLGEDWNDYLQDDTNDLQYYDAVLRRNIITFLLYGMLHAVRVT